VTERREQCPPTVHKLGWCGRGETNTVVTHAGSPREGAEHRIGKDPFKARRRARHPKENKPLIPTQWDLKKNRKRERGGKATETRSRAKGSISANWQRGRGRKRQHGRILPLTKTIEKTRGKEKEKKKENV